MKMPRELIACALWVASFCLLSFGSIDSERDGHNTPLLAWGLFVAVIAAVPTICCIVRRDREREQSIEHIVEIVDALHRGREDVRRLH